MFIDEKSVRNWKEDFKHENGQYACYCYQCGKEFMGYKRRVQCKVCASAYSIDELEEVIKQEPNYLITAQPSEIPQNLVRWRKIRSKTLRDVEEITGISNGYLSQLETGKTSNPSFETVVKLCNCYNVRLTIN